MAKKKTADAKKNKKPKAEEAPTAEPEEEVWYRGQLKIASERLVKAGAEGGVERGPRSAPCLRTWEPPPEPEAAPAFTPPQPVPPPITPLPHWRFFDKEDTGIATKSTKEEAMSVIGYLLPECFSDTNIKFTTFLLYEVVSWAKNVGLDDLKVSSMVGIFYHTHLYFCGSMWRNQEDVYYYFKESILLHSVQHPPKGKKIFETNECQEGILFFCRIYLPYLPLLRMILLPNYRLELFWQNTTGNESLMPSKSKEKKKKK